MKQYNFLNLRNGNDPFIDSLKQAACRVIESGRYIGGPEVDTFEQKLAATCRVNHAIGVSNGLDALTLILRALITLRRLKPGDQIIIPANTYIASVLAATHSGLTPLLVDVDPVTMNIDPQAVARAITPSVRAIMPVHLYGRAAWSHELLDIIRSHRLLVIEDNAQAIGAHAPCPGLNDTRITGSLGHAAAISFYPTKNIGALGDAGAVTTNDPILAKTIRTLANYGAETRYHNTLQGFNSRLDPIQAAMLSVKLAHLDTLNADRFARALAYENTIDNPIVTKPPIGANPLHCVWHQYVIRINNGKRDQFRRLLLEKGVHTDIHYPVPPHMQPCYAGHIDHGPLPVTTLLADQILSLPIGQGTTVADAAAIARIINTINP